jgi:LemA protein
MSGEIREGIIMIVALVIVGLVVLLLLWGVAIYNGLVRLRALVKEGFSGITVQLRRRADLIPNLVSTVEGYATHEREVLTQVTAHRADAVQGGSVAATAQADMAMTGMLGRLMAVAEAYPDLKASENFQQLQGELTEIEDSLQSARRYYNATVRDLNTRIQSFPNVLVARPMGFTEEEFYTDTDASIQTAPVVKFGAAKA